MFVRAYNSAKRRADTRKISFDISSKYLKELYVEQDGLCYYSNMPISMVKRDPKVLHDPFKMTIDRIEPSKGYVVGNVVWCAYCVNSMKQKMPLKTFIGVCRAITKNSLHIKK
jgi:hypothetical protein